MQYRKSPVILIILIILAASGIAIGAKDLQDYQNDIDQTIENLEKSNSELIQDLVRVQKKADDLIAFHEQKINELEVKIEQLDDDQTSQRERLLLAMAKNELFLSLLLSFYDSGLSQTKYPDLIISEQLPGWLQNLGFSGDLGWNKGGLDQLSVLAGMYYIQKRMENNLMLMDMLTSRREYGMSSAEYDTYKHEWKLLSSPEAGIKPYTFSHEAEGLASRGIWAHQLYPLVKINEMVPLPEPGTDAYWEVLESSLICLQRKGIDINKILTYHDNLTKKIRSLEPATAGADFFESIGFEREHSAEDIADITQWRARLLRTSYANFLRLVHSCDADTIAEGLQKQAKAIQSFDEALAFSADAVVTEIEANQKLIEDILSEIPLVGDAMSLYSVLSGSTLSGEAVEGWQRIIEAVMSFGPIGLQGAMKASPSLARMVESLHMVLDGASASQLEKLSSTLHIPVEYLKDVGDFIIGVWG